MLKQILMLLSVLGTFYTNNTSPYIGGNQFNNYYTNPNLINNFLGQINSGISPACNSIPGIGLPILAIKQVLQSIDSSLAYSNNNTYAKVIYFKEKKNNSNYQTSYKLVTQIKTFATNNYLAIEGVYKQIGFPAFEITTYYIDSNLENIKAVLGEYGIYENAFVGCGDVKSIYSQSNPKETASYDVPAPYGQNSKLINAAPVDNGKQGSVDPEVIAQIIKLLQNKN